MASKNQPSSRHKYYKTVGSRGGFMQQSIIGPRGIGPTQMNIEISE